MAMLGWSDGDLSQASGVGTETLQRMDAMEGAPSEWVRTTLAIK
jgi:hypothetical protein